MGLPNPNTDAKTTAEDVPTTFLASPLTTNDSKGPANENGQTLDVVSVQGATHGSVSLDNQGTASTADDTITFTPAADYNGAASFTYTITDDGTTNGLADPKTDT